MTCYRKRGWRQTKVERRLEGGRGEENRGNLDGRKIQSLQQTFVTMDLAKQIQGKWPFVMITFWIFWIGFNILLRSFLCSTNWTFPSGWGPELVGSEYWANIWRTTTSEGVLHISWCKKNKKKFWKSKKIFFVSIFMLGLERRREATEGTKIKVDVNLAISGFN